MKSKRYTKLREIYISDINKDFSFITKILKSIVPFYEKKKPPKSFNTKWRNVKKCYDSGGFSFLMGNISESQLNPDRTIEIYNQMGYEKNDLLLQLDLPPYYFDDKEKRKELIDKNVEFYFYQKGKIKNIIPILHGWEKVELEYNLDKLNGFKSPIAMVNNTCLTKPKVIAVGSNLSLPKSKKVAMGSYLATSKDENRKVSFEKVLNHILFSLQTLDGYETIVLGAGNVNTSHILFSLGAKATDGCSWRIDAAFNRFYIPGRTPISFHNGTRHTGRKPQDEDFEILREIHCNPEHPYSNLSFNEFIRLLKKKSVIRQYHNAYVITLEERIANEFENDSDNYLKYLRRRFESYHSTHHLKVLKYLHKRMKYSYVQQDLEVYLKN